MGSRQSDFLSLLFRPTWLEVWPEISYYFFLPPLLSASRRERDEQEEEEEKGEVKTSRIKGWSGGRKKFPFPPSPDLPLFMRPISYSAAKKGGGEASFDFIFLQGSEAKMPPFSFCPLPSTLIDKCHKFRKQALYSKLCGSLKFLVLAYFDDWEYPWNRFLPLLLVLVCEGNFCLPQLIDLIEKKEICIIAGCPCLYLLFSSFSFRRMGSRDFVCSKKCKQEEEEEEEEEEEGVEYVHESD